MVPAVIDLFLFGTKWIVSGAILLKNNFILVVGGSQSRWK